MITIVELDFTKYKVETLADATTLMEIMERATKVNFNHDKQQYERASKERDFEITMTNKPFIEEEKA